MGYEERLAVILAGDDPEGLKSIALKVEGRAVPKQFCRILGESTLLEQTRQRVALAFPPEKTLTVVTRSHQSFYQHLLTDVPPACLVEQPCNHGTAPAIFYALMKSLKIAPYATVAIFPSDHYVEDDAAFIRHVELAVQGVRTRSDLLVLLGITPDAPEINHCWVEAGDRIAEYFRFFQVRGFWEKPPRKAARRLWQLGWLWNSSVFVARLPVLWHLMKGVFQELSVPFESLHARIGTESERKVVEAIYETIPGLDFSHEVLSKCSNNIAVLPTLGVEWSDLGKPGRVIAALQRSRVRPKWLRDASEARPRK